MAYIVSAFIDGRWQTVLATADRDHAEAFLRDVRSAKAKAKIETAEKD